MERKIRKWLKTREEPLKINVIPLRNYVEIFKKLGFEYSGKDFDWIDVLNEKRRFDFWIYFKKEKMIICLLGSLYSGNYVIYDRNKNSINYWYGENEFDIKGE